MANEKILSAGFFRTQVTPPMGAKIPGYFSTRYSNGIITDLYIQATAFSDGENKAIIFSTDTISITEAAYTIISQKIAERCGVNPGAVYLHATHSHTAFRVGDPSEIEDDPVYADFFPALVRKFVDCAQFAFEDLKPCTFKIARGEAKNISFNRRYLMKDGTYKTNPKTGDPNIVRTAGPVDESLQLLRIIREGGKEILIVNFGTHPDTVSGTLYCADWPGYVVDFLRSAFDGEVEAMMMNGAQGDVNHCNRFEAAGSTYKGIGIPRRMARVIVGEVLKIYDFAEEIPTGEIKFYAQNVKIGKNAYDPEAVPLAQEIFNHQQEFLKTGVKSEFLKNEAAWKMPNEDRLMNVPEAMRIIRNLSAPEFFELNVTGLQIGKVGFIGIPGEPFTHIGTSIKADSKLDMTIVNCLVNGSRGYFPTEDAFAVAGYERSTSRFASNCAQLVIDAGIAIRTEMENA